MIAAKQDDDQFYVQEILDKCFNSKQKKQYYLVKWLNYDIKQSTWEPISHLTHSANLIQQYQQNHHKQSQKQTFQHGIIPFWIPSNATELPKTKLIRKNQKNLKQGMKTKIQAQQSLKYSYRQRNKIKIKVNNINYQTTKKQKLEIQNNQQFELKGKILGMRVKQSQPLNMSVLKDNPYHNQLQYLIQLSNQQIRQWLPRLQIMKNYSRQLAIFYETRLNVKIQAQ